MIVSSLVIAIKLNIYYGKDDEKLDEKLTKSENIILRFMNTVYQKGITIYMDNFYLGPGLIENLTKSGIKCIGTVKKNRILSQSKFDHKIEKA